MIQYCNNKPQQFNTIPHAMSMISSVSHPKFYRNTCNWIVTISRRYTILLIDFVSVYPKTLIVLFECFINLPLDCYILVVCLLKPFVSIIPKGNFMYEKLLDVPLVLYKHLTDCLTYLDWGSEGISVKLQTSTTFIYPLWKCNNFHWKKHVHGKPLSVEWISHVFTWSSTLKGSTSPVIE